MAHSFVVKHGTVTDALGRDRTGWLIFEDGRPGYPYATKENAVRQAKAIAAMRIVNGQITPVTVEEEL